MQGHNPGEKYLAHFTVTVHLAVFFPSVVVAVIVAVPFFFAVTTPLLETVATLVLLLFQVTALFVALLGATVAVNVAVFPTYIHDICPKRTKTQLCYLKELMPNGVYFPLNHL